MTSIDVAPRGRVAPTTRPFAIELFAGDDFAGASWPSITTDPALRMHAFQSRDFLDVWMATIGRAAQVQAWLVVVKDRDGRPVLYLPLAIETKYNVRLLRFTDMGVADFNAPILAAGVSLTRQDFLAVWDEVVSALPKVDAIDLQKISGNVCGTLNPLTYLACSPYASSGHAIELHEPREAHYAKPSIARMRAKLRRLSKKLNERGPTGYMVNPTGAASQHVVDSLFHLKRQQYLRTTGQDFFAMPGVADFYRQMTSPSRIGRISHLSALNCGDRVASAHLGFIGRGQFHWVLPAFDRQFSSFGVGHMLLHHLIEHCFDGGYTVFDLGEGDHSYKTAWETRRLPLYSHERPITTAGLLYLQMRRARRFVGAGRLLDWYAKGRSRVASAVGFAHEAERDPDARAGWRAAL